MIELFFAPMIGIGFYIACLLLARAVQLVRSQPDLPVQHEREEFGGGILEMR